MFLAIDTANPQFSISIFEEGGEAAFYQEEQPQTQAKNLIPAIKKLFSENALQLSDIKGIVVNIGPGSFTGIRIGLSAAQGIAIALLCPVYGVNAFDALAQNQRNSLVTIYAGRANYYCKYEDQAPENLSIEQIQAKYKDAQLIGQLAANPTAANATLIGLKFLSLTADEKKEAIDAKPIYLSLS